MTNCYFRKDIMMHDKLNCPCCEKPMKYKDKGYYGYPFSTGPEPDYPDWIRRDVYTCKDCRIKNVNDEWTIPKKYKRPSEKQTKAVLFINNYLDKDFEPLLSVQCWRIINKYLDKAIKAKQVRDEQMYEDMRDFYDGDFDLF